MAATPKPIARPAPGFSAQGIFVVAAGLFFFIALIKFGDPVILDRLIEPPADFSGVIFDSWQVKWGYLLTVPLVLAGLAAIRWRNLQFKWPLVLPLIWLGWQYLSATQTISPGLTNLTLKHFTACVILFYLGCFALNGNRKLWPLWTGLALALCWIIRMGFEQHFGGLAATRRLLEQLQNDPSAVPTLYNDPNFIRRIVKARIFSTFSNPDALAAAIELLLPLTLVFMWRITPKVRTGIRSLFVVILGGCGLACLYWSGSKAGWLVSLIVGLVALGRANLPMKWKRMVIFGILFLGLAGFSFRYMSSFKRQNVSVISRFAYWNAAIKIAKSRPLLGTGPGTFSIRYRVVKESQDDFARLAHNDYLEQACDSGIPGYLIYTTMIFGYIWWLYRYRIQKERKLNYDAAIWLGLFGLCLHSILDYHLYVPALAWPMFFLLGWAMNAEGLTLKQIRISRFTSII